MRGVEVVTEMGKGREPFRALRMDAGISSDRSSRVFLHSTAWRRRSGPSGWFGWLSFLGGRVAPRTVSGRNATRN
jgi:hypothetical protein